MVTRYVVVLSCGDRSGIMQAFGPFDSEELAKAALADLETWPALSSAGPWDVVPCTDFGTGGSPASPLPLPTTPYMPTYPATPFFPTAPYITCTTSDSANAALYNAAATRFGWTSAQVDMIPADMLRSILSEGGE